MILKADNISRQYFRETKTSNVFFAVKDLSLSVNPGELTAVMGRSGSGKSTMLNMLAGLLTPTQGKVFLDNTDIYAMDDKERSYFRNCNIGVIPQGHTALQSLTVLENVMLPCMMYGSDNNANSYAGELLYRMGIEKLKNAYPNELSGGEMRRLSIARALIKHPAVLLADEPTGDLDDVNTDMVFNLLRDLANENMAVLVVTHEKEATRFADKIYRMDNGVLNMKV